jgi:hypothetical protein
VKLFVFTVPQPASMPTMFTAFAFEKIQMVDLWEGTFHPVNLYRKATLDGFFYSIPVPQQMH